MTKRCPSGMVRRGKDCLKKQFNDKIKRLGKFIDTSNELMDLHEKSGAYDQLLRAGLMVNGLTEGEYDYLLETKEWKSYEKAQKRLEAM